MAEVIDSRHPDFAAGDVVLSHSGWQTHALSKGEGLRKLDPAAAPVTTALGVLGMPGFTAWAGLLIIGKPRPGETVAVAAASGPVGSAVGQIARIKGARAVGIAGGAVWDAVFPLLNPFARIPVCGLIAHYNSAGSFEGPDRLPVVMRDVLTKSLTIRGFIQREFADQRPAFYREMAGWIESGQVKYREDVVEGLENAPQALIGLLEGRNFVKLLIKVS